MVRLVIKKITILLLWIACFSPSLTLAKGLDSLKPGDEETAADPGKSSGANSSPATAATPAPAMGVSSAGSPAPTPIPAGAPTAATATAAPVAKVIEPSRTSKSIANKLHVGTSLGVIKVTKATEGDWASTGAVDLLIGWRFYGGEGSKLNLDANLRYLPMEISAVVDGQSYRGVVEGYHLGPALGYHLSESLDVLASLEIGYLLVYLNSLDRNEMSKDDEANGVEFTVGSGLDWLLSNKKIKFGPRIYAGFGRFQTMQAALAATLLF